MRIKIIGLSIVLVFLFKLIHAQTEEENNDYQYALIEAVKQKNLGNFPEAIKLYKLVVKDKSDCAIAHFELGTIFMMSNQLKTAEMYLQNAYELDPSNYWFTGGYIEILIANKKYKVAEKTLKELIKENDKEVEYQFQLARLYVVSGKEKKAIKILNGIEKENGLSEKVTLLKASVYESSGEYELAKKEIDQVLEFFPESLQFRIVAAELSVKSGNEDDAAEYYRQVFEIDSANIFAITNLTDYYRKKENYSESFYYLKRSFNNDQIDRERKLAILTYYISEEKYVNNYEEELESLIEVYLEKYPEDSDGKLVAVDFFINAQKYGRAFIVLDKYLVIREAPYGLWMQAVLLANAAGMNENLVDITGRALNSFKDSADLVFFRSIGLYGLEMHEELIEELQQVNFESFTNEEYGRSSYNLMAESYNQLEKYDEADRLYEKIIADNPGDYIAMNNYSYYLAERGENLENAKLMSYTAVKENPDNYTFMDTYAWVLYKLGDYENSEHIYRRRLMLEEKTILRLTSMQGIFRRLWAAILLQKSFMIKLLFWAVTKRELRRKSRAFLMNRYIILIILLLSFSLYQCKVVSVLGDNKIEKRTGLAGYGDLCLGTDIINTVTISKADAIITFQGDRYETKLTLYHQLDSFIYISAVSSGYEVFRGTINKDSIKFIDRVNKIVYLSPMKKRFGYQHPVDFKNLECLTSIYGTCELLPGAIEYFDEYILFDISEEFNNKKIYIDRENFKLKKFEFFNTRSNEYIIGERKGQNEFFFSSNFILNEFDIKASGGEIEFNRIISVNMEVNRRKYSFTELQ